MKVLFMGTPDFAKVCLSAIVEEGFDVVGVVTQPDKPKGRSYKLTPPPVKVYAEECGLPVYQPETLRNEAFKEELEALSPDIIIVAAYGKILPPYVIDYPKYGCINIHGSILPKYRGAAPIQRAVMNGDEETGITIQKMNYGVDTGDILRVEKVSISQLDCTGDIFDKLALLGKNIIADTVTDISEGKITPVPQDDSLATHAAKILPEDEVINWNETVQQVHNRIRGLAPFPGAKTTLSGKLVKIYASSFTDFKAPEDAVCGQIVECRKSSLFVKCSDGCIALQTMKPEGSKLLTAADMINGRKVSLGDIFQ